MVSNVRGTFTGVKGTVNYDPANPAAATVEASIDVNTINTNDEKRDGHLKSPDFFDAATYPEITFKSTKVEKESDSEFKVTGNLTLHGVTKPIVLNVEDVATESKDPWGGIRIGATAKTKIKRSDFGLNWNAALETGGFVIGDDVKIELELEFVKVS
jgi:polyisoprenoid-binding protein YceI